MHRGIHLGRRLRRLGMLRSCRMRRRMGCLRGIAEGYLEKGVAHYHIGELVPSPLWSPARVDAPHFTFYALDFHVATLIFPIATGIRS